MIQGIDTSHYSSISVQSLSAMQRQHRLYFNFIKASEGATGTDNSFADNWQMSRKAGYVCGAFHFFRPLSNATAQATNFITQYRKVSRAGVLPPVVDIEWATAKNAPDQWSQVTPGSHRVDMIKEFLIAVSGELNVTPIIYTATNFWNTYIQPYCATGDTSFFGNYPLWIADPNRRGTLPTPWSKSVFIQTHFGENGQGDDPFSLLDQNIFPGSLLTFLNGMVPGFTLAKGFPFSCIVEDIQNVLTTKTDGAGKPYLAGGPDGFFGQDTEAAVSQFQVDNGLAGTGIIDMQTWIKLLA